MSSPNPFSAINPALGYLYQVRLSLLLALRRLRADEDFYVSVEVLDDVAFEPVSGDPATFLQTKHHSSRTGALTDASADVWKTLRVWIEGGLSGSEHLHLITTGVAPPSSAASYLRTHGRDVERARALLDATALTSVNESNSAAYAAYTALSPTERTALLARVLVFDSAPLISDLDVELREEIFWVVERSHHSPFLDRLEGWWLRRVIRQLIAAPGDRIQSAEIDTQMADLREQFRQDSLPIDDDLLDFQLDDATAEAHGSYRFVHQLNIISAGKRRVAAAIRDYFRAYEQRSRWLRDDLLVTTDLRRYEKRLIEEWEGVFNAMADELGDAATDSAKLTAARSVLAWAERAAIPIRPGVTEPFLCRGSLHIVADDGRIGWHPEFRTLIATALQSGVGA